MRTISQAIGDLVDGERLRDLLNDLAAFGARKDGGVDRQALTEEDFRARRFLVDRARSLGAEAYRDSIGNLFFRVNGRENHLPPVVTGSHADSQPTGGRLDGAYGVCAGMEVLAALRESGVVPVRPIEVVIWTNEEGCRFSPGSMGAAAFVKPDRLQELLSSEDRHGHSVEEELGKAEEQFRDVSLVDLARPCYAFVEAHIEQGPLLEETGNTIGLVRGIQATRWFDIEFSGVASHAGTTPRSRRSDAFRSAVELASDLYSMFDAGDDRLRLTIGRVEVEPGSVNVIPERVRYSLDVRHPEESVLNGIEEGLRELAGNHGTPVTVESTMRMKTAVFDDLVLDAARESVEELGLSWMDIDSGAFHDSLQLSSHCPTGMIFVPSVGGLSHTPLEETDHDDLVAGTRVLAGTILRLAGTA